MGDPTTLEDYNAKAMANMRITGTGMNVCTHMPCPGCCAPDWLEFPITAALDDYARVQEPSTCKECGRTFRLDIQSDANSTMGGFVQTGGPDLPDYLPPIARREADGGT